jgi:hypothetical protein
MYVGRDFDPIDPGEEENFEFDFSKEMAEADTIVSAEWEAEVAETSVGEDAQASTRIMGSAVVSGKKVVQLVGTCVGGVTYMLKANIVTSSGEKKSLWSHTECVEPG